MKKALEYLVKKAKANASNLFASTALAVALAASNSQAEVLFTIETSQLNDFPTRTFSKNTNYSPIKVKVYAESTESQDTTGLTWRLVPPTDVSISAVYQPDPATGYFNGSQDFFSPYKMSDLNFNDINGSWRFATGPLGPKSKKGLVGVYVFNPKTDSPAGLKTFTIADTEAYDSNYNLQPSSGNSTTIELVDNYNELTNKAKILIDMSKIPGKNVTVPNLFVDSYMKNKKFVLEASPDMKVWIPLKTNEVFNANLQTWSPYSFRDDKATNYSARFYRTRSQ